MNRRLQALLSDVQTPTELSWQAGTVAVPEEVETAFVGAAHELLRNVDRHANANRASLLVSSDPLLGTLLMVIEDDGRGLGGALTKGIGLTESVFGRLEEVGGSVEFSTPTGGGTRVSLTWKPSKASQEVVSYEAPGLRRMAAVVAAGFAVPQVVYALIGVTERPQVYFAAGIVVALMTMTVLVVRKMPDTDGALGVATAVVCVASIAVGSAVFGVHAIAGGSASWVLALTLLLGLAAGISWPPRRLVVFALAEILALVSMAVALDELGAVATGIVAIVGFAGLSGYVGVKLRKVSQGIERDLELAFTESSRAERLAALGAARDAQYRRFVDDIVPFLDAVAEGDIDPGTDADARATAQLYALAVRDELALPGMLDARARSDIGVLRTRGCEVSLWASDANRTPSERAGAVSALVHELAEAGFVGQLNIVVDPAAVSLVTEPALGAEQLQPLREALGSTFEVQGPKLRISW